MAAPVAEALGRDADLLRRRVEAARRTVDHFCLLCDEYVKHPITSRSDESIHLYFRRWFQIYLAVADEAMVLMTGRLCRTYQIDEHMRLYAQASSAPLPRPTLEKNDISRDVWTDRRESCGKESSMDNSISAIHSRGKEALVFKNADSLSRCSVDGFNYEYRRVIGKKAFERFEDQLDLWSSSVESSSSEIDLLVKRAKSYFVDSLHKVLGLDSLRASQIAINDFRHLGESFSFLLRTELSEADSVRRTKDYYSASENSVLKRKEMDTPRCSSGTDPTFVSQPKRRILSNESSLPWCFSNDIRSNVPRDSGLKAFDQTSSMKQRDIKDSLLSSFRFDREIEVASVTYSKNINLNSRDVLNNELATLRKLAEPSQKKPRGPQSRVIVDSDDEDGHSKAVDSAAVQDDVVFQPRLKRPQPLAREQCMPISGESAESVLDAFTSGSESLSIRKIKRLLGADPEALEAHMDAAEAEHNWASKNENSNVSDGVLSPRRPFLSIETNSHQVQPSVSVETNSSEEDAAALGKKLLEEQLLRCRVFQVEKIGVLDPMEDPGASSIKLFDFELCFFWLPGAAQRVMISAAHKYSISYEFASSGGSPAIPVASILDIAFQLLRGDENHNGSSTLIPSYLTTMDSSMSKIILRDGDFLTPPRDKIVSVDLACFKISGVVESIFISFLNAMKGLETRNEVRLGRRTLLPPFVCIRKLVPELSKAMGCDAGSIRIVNIELRDIIALSLHPRFVPISCGDFEDVRPLQHNLIECIFESIKSEPLLRCTADISRLYNSVGVLFCLMKNCLSVKARSIGICCRSLVQEYLRVSSSESTTDDRLEFHGYALKSLDLSCNRSFGLIDSTNSVPMINSMWKRRYRTDLIPSTPQLDHRIISEHVLEASMRLLLQLPALLSLDVSHCWSESTDAIRLANAISKAALHRVGTCNLPPLDELRILGLSSTLTDSESASLYRALETSGGFKTIRNDE